MSNSEVVFRKMAGGGGRYEVYRRCDNRYLGRVSSWFDQWKAEDGRVYSYRASRRDAGEWLIARYLSRGVT